MLEKALLGVKFFVFSASFAVVVSVAVLLVLLRRPRCSNRRRPS